MPGAFDDMELAEDPVGVASARLFAAGVPRAERVLAMRLLSVLLTVADANRRVRRPLVDVAGEFELPTVGIESALDRLLDVGAVHLDRGTIVVPAEAPPSPGISLHDFLDAAAELDARPAVVPMRRRFAPVGAVLAAAAVVAAVVLVPKVAPDEPTITAAASRRPSVTQAPTSTVQPSRAASGSDAAPSRAPEPAAGGVERVGPVLVPTTTTIAPACPVGVPTIEVLGATNRADGVLAVDGIARNPTSRQVVVRTFDLRTIVAGALVVAPGGEQALVVPAGGSVHWQASLPVAAPPGTVVEASLVDWEWPELPAGCPAPVPPAP